MVQCRAYRLLSRRHHDVAASPVRGAAETVLAIAVVSSAMQSRTSISRAISALFNSKVIAVSPAAENLSTRAPDCQVFLFTKNIFPV
jgi:hypothetical protein